VFTVFGVEKGYAPGEVQGGTRAYADIEAKYRYGKCQVAREKGQRPQAASINLGGF
jgi:hypothetical protein